MYINKSIIKEKKVGQILCQTKIGIWIKWGTDALKNIASC